MVFFLRFSRTRSFCCFLSQRLSRRDRMRRTSSVGAGTATGVPSACTATDAPDPSRSSGWMAGAARAVEIAACCHMPRCMHTRTGIDMPRANDDMLDAAIGAWQEAAAVFSSHDIT